MKEVPLTLEVGGKVVGTAKVTSIGGVHEVTVTDTDVIEQIQKGYTSFSHMSVADPAVTYSENTLAKVRDALCKAGVNDDQSIRAINEMSNHGILFRERA